MGNDQVKRILFITGTRADYGKIKSLMLALEADPAFDVHIFVCGMHLQESFGSTYREIEKDGYRNIFIARGLNSSKDAAVNLGNTIAVLSEYAGFKEPDMIVVHGDRPEALAGAAVGALRNILVGHIEGGELSGTVDDSIRHAVSKLSHVHFVSNDEAASRLEQLGEDPSHIYVIGSPDIDIMMSDELPSLAAARERYEIPFDNYAIFVYHPVTTEYESTAANIRTVINALRASGRNYIVVYPNNDLGSDYILNEIKSLTEDEHFRVFPSLRFEYFLTLLKNADFIIGNSSAGIRESGVYGISAIDIGSRQQGRWSYEHNPNLQHVDEDVDEIAQAVGNAPQYCRVSRVFGRGDSTEKFLEILREPGFWEMEIQKVFIDLDI